MATRHSARLAAVIDDLPFRPDSRVLEIGGCGPAVAARAIAEQLTTGHLLAIDRSANAITQATSSAADLIASGWLSVRHSGRRGLRPGA